MQNEIAQQPVNPLADDDRLDRHLHLAGLDAQIDEAIAAGTTGGAAALERDDVGLDPEWLQQQVRDDVDPDIVGLPRRFFIDIEKKIVLPSKESMVRRISKINHVEHIENKVMLQGVEEGVESVDDSLAWSIVISKKSGKVVLSAAGDGVAYVVFGSCTELD